MIKNKWLTIVSVLVIGAILLSQNGFTAQARASYSPANQTSSSTLFFDDFSGDLSQWSDPIGNWYINQGGLQGSDLWGASIYAGDTSWTDYALQAKITFLGNKAKVYLRCTDPRNRYEFEFWKQDVSPSEYANRYSILKFWDYYLRPLTGNGPGGADFYNISPVAITNPVIIRAQVSGNHLSLFINNEFVYQVYDSGPITNGRIGLGTVSDETARFDDILVTTDLLPVPPFPTPPVAEFSYEPSELNIYRDVQFHNSSYDTGAGIQSVAWEFGDGATSSDWEPVHRYSVDGEYTVTLTVTTVDGRSASSSNTVNVLTPEITDPPVAEFDFGSESNIIEPMWFSNLSYDPGYGFQSAAWDFGDGTTSSDWSPLHRYSADGDYTVTLTVTTVDGRSASSSKTASVRTHDVWISGFDVPTTAKVGQTRDLFVYLVNNRYPETVQVELYKSHIYGFDLVDSKVLDVPVKPSQSTTPVAFKYRFTSDDAFYGRVSFKAVVTVWTGRDALPEENTIILFPTRVNP